MIKKFILAIITIQLTLFADFQSIDAKQLIKLQKAGYPVIDIRTPSEWKETGVIPNSKEIMFFDENGKYDVDKFLSKLQKVVKDKNQPFIIVCRTASRTKVVGKFLSKEMGYKNVKELAGGMMFGWGSRTKTKLNKQSIIK